MAGGQHFYLFFKGVIQHFRDTFFFFYILSVYVLKTKLESGHVVFNPSLPNCKISMLNSQKSRSIFLSLTTACAFKVASKKKK